MWRFLLYMSVKQQKHILDAGLFELKEFVRGDYTDIQTLITPKGREAFSLLSELADNNINKLKHKD